MSNEPILDIVCTLRPATEQDYTFLWSLHKAALGPHVAKVYGWDETLQAQLFRERFDPARRSIIVVADQDVGVLEVTEGEDGVFLDTIEIMPEHQGRGLGGTVTGDVVRNAHAAGLPVTLRVLKVNPARRLYERLGFVEIGQTETHFIMCAWPAQPRKSG
jgi:ribosomal protein S18 acetylase RimI-like enzyme